MGGEGCFRLFALLGDEKSKRHNSPSCSRLGITWQVDDETTSFHTTHNRTELSRTRIIPYYSTNSLVSRVLPFITTIPVVAYRATYPSAEWRYGSVFTWKEQVGTTLGNNARPSDE